MKKKNESGFLSLTILVFLSIFVAVFAGLASMSTIQSRVQKEKEQSLTAMEIAEAGFDYYKWYLAHWPDDITDGTGLPGPYVHDYVDPETSSIGKFSLVVSGDYQCGIVARVDIESTGWVNDNPDVKKTIYGSYARPSAAEYSYILDSPVIAGSSRVIYGPYHSNGGINFLGTNFSSVTSAQTTWNCTSSYCTPAESNAPGVTGSGGSKTLWKWPVPQIDFNVLAKSTTDVFKKYIATSTPSVCTSGQTKGCFFPRVSDVNGRKGYHVVMKSDGTFDLYRVNTTEAIKTVSTLSNPACITEYSVIANTGSGGICPYTPTAGATPAQTSLGNFTPPATCRVLFFDDNVWLEGVVKNKITIIAASSTSSSDPNIYIRNNITYATTNGTDGLTAVAENNVQMPIDSPQDLTIKGVYVAQKGFFGRNYYITSGSCNVASKYSGCTIQGNMYIVGSVVSKGRVGTQWSGTPGSGYTYREDNYDSALTLSPPPFTPYTSDDYRFIQWNQR